MRNCLTPQSENAQPHSRNSIENVTPWCQSWKCDPIQRHIPISGYTGPSGFRWLFSCLDFSPHEKAVSEPRSGEHESQSGEKEKPLVILDLNLTFRHKRASRRRKSIWLVLLISYIEGTVGISLTALLVVNFCLQNYTSVLTLYTFTIRLCSTWIVFQVVSSKEFWPRYSGSVFQRLKVSPNIKALLAVINGSDVFAILPTGHGKSIIINSVVSWILGHLSVVS